MPKNDPQHYREMSIVRPNDEANAAIKEFFKAVEKLRDEHKLQDVHVIVQVSVTVDETDEAHAFACAHFGAVQEAEGMCAWALARAAEDRRQYVTEMSAEGKARARRRG